MNDVGIAGSAEETSRAHAFGARFFQISAGCALLSAAAVVVAQFSLSGYENPSGLDALPRLYSDPIFRAQGLVILFQVMLMFVALWGVVVAVYGRSPALIATAFLFLLFWQILELVPRAVDVFAASGTWAAGWSQAATQSERESATAALAAWQPIWSALGVIRRVVWGLAHLLLGIAFVRWSGLTRWIGLLFLLNALRLLPRTAGEIVGAESLANLAAGPWWFIAGTIPLFTLIGVWLWQVGVHLAATDSASTRIASSHPA